MRKSTRVTLVAAAMFADTLLWAQGIPKLSKAQRSALVQKLSLENRRWLDDFVAPIIFPDEENLFLLLTEDHHREVFKEESVCGGHDGRREDDRDRRAGRRG